MPRKARRCSLTAQRPRGRPSSAWTAIARACERLIEAPADLGEASAIESLFALIRERTGRLDILVNNAVLQGIGYAFEDTPLEQFEKVLRVNLVGLFHVSREAVKMMLVQGGGAIVNIGSNVSTRAIRKRSGYVASKGGVDAPRSPWPSTSARAEFA